MNGLRIVLDVGLGDGAVCFKEEWFRVGGFGIVFLGFVRIRFGMVFFRSVFWFIGVLVSFRLYFVYFI